MVFVPVTVVTVLVCTLVIVLVVLNVIVGMLKYDEQKLVAEEYWLSVVTTSLTRRHSADLTAPLTKEATLPGFGRLSGDARAELANSKAAKGLEIDMMSRIEEELVLQVLKTLF